MAFVLRLDALPATNPLFGGKIKQCTPKPINYYKVCTLNKSEFIPEVFLLLKMSLNQRLLFKIFLKIRYETLTLIFCTEEINIHSTTRTICIVLVKALLFGSW